MEVACKLNLFLVLPDAFQIISVQITLALRKGIASVMEFIPAEGFLAMTGGRIATLLYYKIKQNYYHSQV